MSETLPRILLTGAGGFVGRRVAKALAGRGTVFTPAENPTGRRCDLLRAGDRADLVAAVRPEILLHLAWVTEHGKFWASPLNADWEAASLDLFARAAAAGCRRILGTGTCAEYDWTTGAERFAEDAPLAPHTPYGAAKLRTAEALARLAEGFGIGWSWARIFFLFGEGEPATRLVPLMLTAAREGRELGIGPGAMLRDFWDVRNLGDALAALALSDLSGPVNLASGTGTSFADLARMVEAQAGTSGLIRPDSRPPGPGEPMRLVADATRMRRDLGVTDRVTLAQGLADHPAARG